MASIFVELNVPENLEHLFRKPNFNPFTALVLSLNVEKDEDIHAALSILDSIRYQQQRNKKRILDEAKPAD